MNLTKEQIDFLREEGVKEVYSGGIPFVEQKAYILQQRINKAIEILKDTSVDMDSILLCETIGYAIHILKGSDKE